MTFKVRNPRNGKLDYEFELPSKNEIAENCQRLRKGQKKWNREGVAFRVEILQKWKNSVNKHLDEIIEALIIDTGRKKESIIEAQLVASSIDRWCGIATDFLSNKIKKTASIPFIGIEQGNVPYGLVGVISPWNFPLLLSLIDSIPALLAGCSVIVKPSEVTPRFIEPMMKSIQDVPELAEVFHYVSGDGGTGAALLSNIDLVCFTGSVATGKKIYHAAAENFIPAFLELGGKDPALVFEGADLEMATSSLLWASTSNCGHSCLSIERIYVQESIYNEFLEKLVTKTKALKLSYPNMDDGQLGPVIAERQVEIIDEHLKEAVQKGAKIHCGSERCENLEGGLWCKPTVLSNVNHEMKVMTEETFGPIIPVMSFKDEAEGIRLANDTQFGLSAAVFAKNVEDAKRIGSQIEAGAISINDAGLTAMVHEGFNKKCEYSITLVASGLVRCLSVQNINTYIH